MSKFSEICATLGFVSLMLAITLYISSEAALNYHKAQAYEAEEQKHRIEFEKTRRELLKEIAKDAE